MKIFISGGCKNGKSYHAQHLAKKQQKDNGALYYIATMRSFDSEDDSRIIRHKKERDGWGFTTIEQSCDIEKILDKCDHNGSFLLDSLTALLINEMLTDDDNINNNALDKIENGLLEIIKHVENIVIVSDYIYSDALLYNPLTDKFRKSLAALDRLAAQKSDVVLEVSYAHVITHKGKL